MMDIDVDVDKHLDRLSDFLETFDSLDTNERLRIENAVRLLLLESTELRHLREKLSIIFAYEKHSLELIKEYKEEIKYVSTLQEDLRRERANFFSKELKEVTQTLPD